MLHGTEYEFARTRHATLVIVKSSAARVQTFQKGVNWTYKTQHWYEWYGMMWPYHIAWYMVWYDSTSGIISPM